MSYPPNTTSLLAMLDTTGVKFIEQQGHTALHKAMRANAAAGIVSAAAAVQTVSKLDSINQSVVTLGGQIAAGAAANAQLEARVAQLESEFAQSQSAAAQLAAGVALLQKKAESLDEGLDRLRAREREYAHALGGAHHFMRTWLQRNPEAGPTLALGLADASHFWLVQASRILEDADGRTISQRIETIQHESGRFVALVSETVAYAGSCNLPDLMLPTGASLQWDGYLATGATEKDARAEIARRAGLALWLFALVALTDSDASPAGGVPSEPRMPAPLKGKPARRAA